MTTLHAANDPGYYSGPLINISPHSGDILWMIKSAFKTANWQIPFSGDGNAIVDALYNDILTNNTRNNVNSGNSPKIANSICNDLAWFVLETPNASPESGQLCIQLVSYVGGTLNIRAKWSSGGFANTGTATQVPPAITPGDEKLLIGAGPDNAPVGHPINSTVYTEYSMRFNMGLDDNAVNPRSWMTLWKNGTRHDVTFSFIIDFLAGLKGTDTYPYIAAMVYDQFLGGGVISPFDTLGAYVNIDSNNRGVATKFAANTRKMSATAPGLPFVDSLSGIYASSLVRGLGKNSVSGKECLAPLVVARHSSLPAATGIKGYSTYVFWSLKDMSLGDHLDVLGPKDYVYIGDLLAPWNSPNKCIP